MKRLLPSLLLTFSMLVVGMAAQSSSSRLAITAVTVIDGTGSPAQSDMTVLVTAGRFSAIGKTGQIGVPVDAQVIDGKGKFMIAGLWDMHVHVGSKEELSLFLANGVTGIRTMFGTPMQHAWRKEIDRGTLPGPRMVIASPLVDGVRPMMPGSLVARDEAEGRAAVRQSRKEGADFIKVYSLLSREAFFAIADEAKKQRTSFAGHVPASVSPAEASDAGMKTIEHLTGILEASSTVEEQLRGRRQETQLRAEPSERAAFERMLVDGFSAEKAALVMGRLKRNQTRLTPTLTVLARFLVGDDDAAVRVDPRLKYIPAQIASFWQQMPPAAKTEASEQSRRVFQRYIELVGLAHRARLELLAGTDTGNPFLFPGFSLHDELAWLVRAGLSPSDALQAATRNPARLLGREKDLGTIEKGKIADFVLLDANPLADIGHTRNIHAVSARGRLLDRAALNQLLSNAERVAIAN